MGCFGSFLGGMMFGGLVGMMVMAILSIARDMEDGHDKE